MRSHLPILIVALPLAGAVAVPVLGLASRGAARVISLGVLLGSLLAAVGALRTVLDAGVWRYELGGWAPPWGIEYVVDLLGGGMAVLVSFMALLSALYSGPWLAQRPGLGASAHQALHLLLSAGLLGMVLTGDAFNLYVFLEISAIAGYALLAGGGDRAAVAAFRYLLVGTVAASFYLLGLGHLYALTGTLNLSDLAVRLSQVPDSAALATGLALIAVGLAVKIALFPLHGWLPDAYAYAPVHVTTFVSSVAGKAGVYVLLRLFLFVLEGRGAAGRVLDLLAPVAAAAIVAGSVLALAQRDLLRMLAYSSVAQMGYVVLGIGLGTAGGLTGALLHVANHAVMKACLLMAAGNVLWRAGTTLVSGCAGMGRRLPITMASFVVAALSMIGLPPMGGFFSKWHLILGALEAGAWPYVIPIVAGSVLTAVYLFRVLEAAYFPSAAESAARHDHSADGPLEGSVEAPWPMMAAPAVLALGVLGLGWFNQGLVEAVLLPSLPAPGR